MREIYCILGLFVFWAAAVPPLAGQTPSVTRSGDDDTSDKLTWTYTFRISKIPDGKKAEIRLAVPASGSFPGALTASAGCTPSGPQINPPFYEWTIEAATGTTECEITLPVSGLKTQVKPDTVRYLVKVDGVEASKGTIEGPGPLYDASWFRPVFGGAWNYRFDDHVDFKVEKVGDIDYLLTINDSKTRAAALVGGLFKLRDVKWKFQESKPVDLLLSLEFAQNTTETLDGIVFGLGIGLNRYAELVFGYSLRKGQELSKGFKGEAARIIAEQQAANNPDYARFRLNARKDDLADIEQWDGFSLKRPGGSLPVFPGSPINQSFNSSFSIGIVVPIDFKPLFQRKE